MMMLESHSGMRNSLGAGTSGDHALNETRDIREALRTLLARMQGIEKRLDALERTVELMDKSDS